MVTILILFELNNLKFQSLSQSKEEDLFSMEEILCNIVEDKSVDLDILKVALAEFEKYV